MLRDYASTHGLEVVQEFQEAETAKKAGRTQFNAMVRFLKKHRGVKTILVEKTDRLYRNFHDLVKVDELGVSVHLVKEGQVLDESTRSSDKLSHNIKVVLAKNYVDNLSEETVKGQVQKARSSIYPSYAPLGYVNNRLDKTIEVDEERAPLIRRVFEHYAYEGGNLGTATKKAKEWGLIGRKGRPRNRGQIQSMLKSVFYLGDFIWKGEYYIGSHPPIVSRSLFNRVQELMHGRAKPRNRTHHFAFRGLLKCGACGCAITAERKKGKYTYYRCTYAKGKCGQKPMREEGLALALGEPLRGLRMSDERAEWLAAMLAQETEQERHALREDERRLTRKLDGLTHKLDQAYEDRLAGVIPEAFWTRKQSEFSTRQQQLEDELHRLQATDSKADSLSVERILELTQEAYSLYLTQDPDEQRKLLDILLSNSILDGDTVKPKFHEPFATIAFGVAEEEALAQKNGPEKAENEIWLPCLDVEAERLLRILGLAGSTKDHSVPAIPHSDLLNQNQALRLGHIPRH